MNDGETIGRDDEGSANGRYHPLTDLMDALIRTSREETLTVGRILDKLEKRSFGPLLLVPALISVIPVIGALPGVTWTTSALVLIVSLHFVTNSKQLWIPGRLRRIKVSRETFRKGVCSARPWLRRIDRLVRPRFHFLFRPPWTFVVALLCVLMSIGMFVGSIVPGGVVVPALGVLLLSIGLTARDGAVMVLGALASAGSIWVIWALVR